MGGWVVGLIVNKTSSAPHLDWGLGLSLATFWFKFHVVHVPGKDNPAPYFMSRCKQDKQADLALIYSDQECWDVESPIFASVTQALNCVMGNRAVTFSLVEWASE